MDAITLSHSVSVTDFSVSPDEEHLLISVYEHGITVYHIDADASGFTTLFHLLQIHDSLIINAMWLNSSKVILQTEAGFYIHDIHTRTMINMFDDDSALDVSLFNFIHDNTELVCLYGKNMLAHFSYEGGCYHQTRMVEVPVVMVSNLYISPNETIIVSGYANTNNYIVVYQGTLFDMVHISVVPASFDDAYPFYTIPMPNRANPTHVMVLFCDAFQSLRDDLYAIIELKAVDDEDFGIEYCNLEYTDPDIKLIPGVLMNQTIGYQVIMHNPQVPRVYLFNILTRERIPVGDTLPISRSHYVKSGSAYKQVTYKKIEATGCGSTYIWNKMQKATWIRELTLTNLLLIGNRVYCQRNNKQCIEAARPGLYKCLGDALPSELTEAVLSYSYC